MEVDHEPASPVGPPAASPAVSPAALAAGTAVEATPPPAKPAKKLSLSRKRPAAEPAEPEARAGPGYKYLETVRGKDARRRLNAETCDCCAQWYAGMTPEERQQRLANVSRHRCTAQRPPSPEGFWSVGFPNTEDDTQQQHLRLGRRASPAPAPAPSLPEIPPSQPSLDNTQPPVSTGWLRPTKA